MKVHRFKADKEQLKCVMLFPINGCSEFNGDNCNKCPLTSMHNVDCVDRGIQIEKLK